MDSKKLAAKLLDELDYYIDGYYLSGNGREEIKDIIEKVLKESEKKQ